MPNILVRNLDLSILGRLKAAAKRHGRSLQGELKSILTDSAAFSADTEKISARWHKRLKGRKLSDSTALIRKDRKR